MPETDNWDRVQPPRDELDVREALRLLRALVDESDAGADTYAIAPIVEKAAHLLGLPNRAQRRTSTPPKDFGMQPAAGSDSYESLRKIGDRAYDE
jgi:hypothetical protein